MSTPPLSPRDPSPTRDTFSLSGIQKQVNPSEKQTGLVDFAKRTDGLKNNIPKIDLESKTLQNSRNSSPEPEDADLAYLIQALGDDASGSPKNDSPKGASDDKSPVITLRVDEEPPVITPRVVSEEKPPVITPRVVSEEKPPVGANSEKEPQVIKAATPKKISSGVIARIVTPIKKQPESAKVEQNVDKPPASDPRTPIRFQHQPSVHVPKPNENPTTSTKFAKAGNVTPIPTSSVANPNIQQGTRLTETVKKEGLKATGKPVDTSTDEWSVNEDMLQRNIDWMKSTCGANTPKVSSATQSPKRDSASVEERKLRRQGTAINQLEQQLRNSTNSKESANETVVETKLEMLSTENVEAEGFKEDPRDILDDVITTTEFDFVPEEPKVTLGEIPKKANEREMFVEAAAGPIATSVFVMGEQSSVKSPSPRGIASDKNVPKESVSMTLDFDENVMDGASASIDNPEKQQKEILDFVGLFKKPVNLGSASSSPVGDLGVSRRIDESSLDSDEEKVVDTLGKNQKSPKEEEIGDPLKIEKPNLNKPKSKKGMGATLGTVTGVAMMFFGFASTLVASVFMCLAGALTAISWTIILPATAGLVTFTAGGRLLYDCGIKKT